MQIIISTLKEMSLHNAWMIVTTYMYIPLIYFSLSAVMTVLLFVTVLCLSEGKLEFSFHDHKFSFT